jgi:hypothetical protein
MRYLKDKNFNVIALRDLKSNAGSVKGEDILRNRKSPRDPLLSRRYPPVKDPLPQSVERDATLKDLDFWLGVMLRDFGYSPDEVSRVAGAPPAKEVIKRLSRSHISAVGEVRALPYPGGRHPRAGFLDGAVNPMRGTKAGVFLPWDPRSYVVIDLPEALFSNLGLTFLAHTHIPTIWDEKNRWIDNVDWMRGTDGSLSSEWNLPNGISFGASIRPQKRQAYLELWLRNGTANPLTGLRTQVCAMLKMARGFSDQTAANKQFLRSAAAVHSNEKDRWIVTAWQRAGRVWGNPPCPCIHSDPTLPDCLPGQLVRVKGILAFYEGRDIDPEVERITSELTQRSGSAGGRQTESLQDRIAFQRE